MNKQRIYELAKARLIENYGAEMLTTPGNCAFWLQVAGAVLLDHGVTPYPQAGTMLWRILPHELDPDPTDPNVKSHFGFEWSPTHPCSLEALANNRLPEMHLWIALKERREVIDFSTGGFVAYAERHGLKWQTPHPPEYLWCSWDDMPPGAIYKPERDAIQYFIKRKMKDHAEEKV